MSEISPAAKLTIIFENEEVYTKTVFPTVVDAEWVTKVRESTRETRRKKQPITVQLTFDPEMDKDGIVHLQETERDNRAWIDPGNPKAAREKFSTLQSLVNRQGGGNLEPIMNTFLQNLIDQLEQHRPTGSDGKHGNLHTTTCGCEDK